MKTFKYLLAAFACVVFLFNGCNKPEEIVTQADIPLKGKPGGSGITFANTAAQLQVYGVWHAGNDYCTWGTKGHNRI